MEWKKIGKSCFEVETDKFYFHLRKEKNIWVLDIFENNNLLKYLESFEFRNLVNVQNDAKNHIPYLR